MRKFKNGETVEYVGETYYGLIYGMHGTVICYPKKGVANPEVSFNRKNPHIVVKFPDTVRATCTCDGFAPDGDGLYVYEKDLKKVKEK